MTSIFEKTITELKGRRSNKKINSFIIGGYIYNDIMGALNYGLQLEKEKEKYEVLKRKVEEYLMQVWYPEAIEGYRDKVFQLRRELIQLINSNKLNVAQALDTGEPK